MKTTRKLNFSDTFRIARIINSAGMTAKDVMELIGSRDSEKAEIAKIKDKKEREEKLSEMQEAAGLEMVSYIIEKAPAAENAINKFLGSMAGCKDTEIAEAAVPEIIELIKDIFEQNKDIKDFFISAFRSATVIPSTKS